MTLNEKIEQFIQKLISWSSRAGVRLAELDDIGMESSKEAQKILQDTKDVMELVDSLYVSHIDLVDDDFNVQYTYLTNEADIEEMMESWSYYLKLDTLPYGHIPLNGKYFVTTIGSTSVGSGLPSGGGSQYILGQDSSGNPVWILKPTILELDETV